jgi:hypothetical protein
MQAVVNHEFSGKYSCCAAQNAYQRSHFENDLPDPIAAP